MTLLIPQFILVQTQVFLGGAAGYCPRVFRIFQLVSTIVRYLYAFSVSVSIVTGKLCLPRACCSSQRPRGLQIKRIP
jgi:hypothetical protein